MFKRILVPLDGSEFAERALEPAFQIASKFGSEIILLRVMVVEEPSHAAPRIGALYYGGLGDLSLEGDREDAGAYLYAIKSQWIGAGTPIHTRIAPGAPPEIITEVAEEEEVELIVMSTHGRSGFSRLIYGSVAEAVLRGARVPLLLVPIKS